MKKNKLAGILVTIALVTSSILPLNASAVEKTKNKVSLSKTISSVIFDSEKNDKAITKKFRDTGKNLLKKKDTNSIKVDLTFGNVANSKIDCIAEGAVFVNDEKSTFEASGQLYMLTVANGDVIYIGGLHGSINKSYNPNDIIDLSVHYNPKTKEAYIPLNIGAFIDNDNIPVQLEYGERFSGIDEATKKVTEIISKVQQPTEAAPMIQPYTIRSKELRKTASGSTYGYTTVYSSLWGQSGTPQNSVYQFDLKVQTNKSNFVTAINSQYTYNPDKPYQIYTTIEHAVCDYWNVARSSTSSINFNGAFLPQNANNNVRIYLPYLPSPVSTLLSYLSPTIIISGITTSIPDNQHLTQHAWGTNITSILTTNSSPYGESTGCSGQFDMTNNLPLNSSGTLYGYSAVQYFYLGVQGDGTTVSKWSTASTTEMSQTLTTCSSSAT